MRETHKDTERQAGRSRQTGIETPAVASPAVIIVLTFK